jgi:hypothetical protein
VFGVFVRFSCAYRDKKVVGVFVRFHYCRFNWILVAAMSAIMLFAESWLLSTLN